MQTATGPASATRRSPDGPGAAEHSVVAGPGRNAERITRLFARFVSVGYIAFFSMQLKSISVVASRTDPWWTPLALVSAYGLGMLPGIISFWARPRTMRYAALAAAFGYLVAVVTWFGAWNGPAMPPEVRVWFTSFTGLAAISVVVAGWLWWSFGYLIVAGVAVQIVKFVSRDETGWVPFAPELVHTIVYNTVFMVAVAMALRTGAVLDRSESASRAVAASEAAQHARAVERERFDGLTHDAVLHTLMTAARSPTPESARHEAVAALAELDRYRSRTVLPVPGEFSAASSVAALLDTVVRGTGDADVGDFADIDVDCVDEDLSAPGEAVHAMCDAFTEALRNSVRHAGPDASRRVAIRCDDGVLTAEVTDDGVGFDPAAVDQRRLGIAVSIVGRLNRIDGGLATVRSAPGVGTTVTLTWTSS